MNGLGAVYIDLGMLEEAEKCLKKALEIGKERYDSIHPLKNLRERYLSMGGNRGTSRVSAILAYLWEEERDVQGY